MNRQGKINLLRNIYEGKIKVEQLKIHQNYYFKRIGNTNQYRDSILDKTMSLQEIEDMVKPVEKHVNMTKFVVRNPEKENNEIQLPEMILIFPEIEIV